MVDGINGSFSAGFVRQFPNGVSNNQINKPTFAFSGNKVGDTAPVTPNRVGLDAIMAQAAREMGITLNPSAYMSKQTADGIMNFYGNMAEL